MTVDVLEESLNGESHINDLINDDDNNSNSTVVENVVMEQSIEKINFKYQKSQNKQIIKREKLFNDFLREYTQTFTKKSKQKYDLKNKFFEQIMGLFIGIPILCFLLLIVFAICHVDIVAIITSIIASFVEIISSFIILPKIIAEYLFDKEEDKNLINLIIKMQDYNLSSKNKGNKKDSDNNQNNN